MFRNFGYEFLWFGGDVWRWLYRHVCRKISAHVDLGRAEGLACTDQGVRTPVGVNEIFLSEVFKVKDNYREPINEWKTLLIFWIFALFTFSRLLFAKVLTQTCFRKYWSSSGPDNFFLGNSPPSETAAHVEVPTVLKNKNKFYFYQWLKKLIRAACLRCHETKCTLLTAFFFSFFLFLCYTYFSPRRGYRRVPKFCMGF